MYTAINPDIFDISNVIDVEESKQCSKCCKNLPLKKFSIASGGNYTRSECRDCESELNKVRTKIKKYAPACPVDYICPICMKTADQIKGHGGKKSGEWCCDHDHELNVFRGWLCHSCNRALGAFGDDVDRLSRAIKYLQK
jgi:hypothetical protein